MSDTESVPMRATFLGGPADGGELVLAEPIREWIRFPLGPLEAVDLFEPLKVTGAPLVPVHVPAEYRLDMLDGNPWRDRAGRVRYRYTVPQPHPKETTHE